MVVDQNSELHGPALCANLEAVDPIIVHQEALVQPPQPAIIHNTESSHDKNQEINDLPTFDEALKMEIVKMDKSQSETLRAKQEDDFPVVYQKQMTNCPIMKHMNLIFNSKLVIAICIFLFH